MLTKCLSREILEVFLGSRQTTFAVPCSNLSMICQWLLVHDVEMLFLVWT